MIQSITLTNEQAINLYNYLSALKLDRAKNRNRWKFLEVLETNVFSYEKATQELRSKAQASSQEATLYQGDKDLSVDQKMAKRKTSEEYIKTLDKEMEKLQETKLTFDFNDREIFAEGKTFFEIVGNPRPDESKPNDPPKEWLTGREGKIYKEIQDAFLAVKESEKK